MTITSTLSHKEDYHDNSMKCEIDNLLSQSFILTNQTAILLAWDNWMSVTIPPNFSDEELILVHQIKHGYCFEDYSLSKSENIYKLYLCRDLKLAFHLCKHSTYTPIDIREHEQSKLQVISECLECYYL